MKLSEMPYKRVDMDDYDVNTYDIVSYEDSSSLTNELNTKHYIYDSSKSYKLASFKIKAPSSTAITINWVSFTNKWNLNINDVLDEDEISLKVNNKAARKKW